MLAKQVICPYCKLDIESFSPRVVLTDVFDVVHYIHVACYSTLCENLSDSLIFQDKVKLDRVVNNLKLIGIEVRWSPCQ